VVWAEYREYDWDRYYVITESRREDDALVLEAAGWTMQIEIYGRGDFNGDGTEDLLLHTFVDYVPTFRGEWPHLFLLVRDGPDKPTRIAWEYGIDFLYRGCEERGSRFAKPDEKPYAEEEVLE
jgi:hypothetical protein